MYYGYVALDEILHNCMDLDYNLSNRTCVEVPNNYLNMIVLRSVKITIVPL